MTADRFLYIHKLLHLCLISKIKFQILSLAKMMKCKCHQCSRTYFCCLFQAINVCVEFVQLVVAVSNNAVQTSDFIVRLLQLFSQLNNIVLVLLASR